MAAPMEKTAERGIYKRGSRYVVVYYLNGKQRKESAPNFNAARQLKRQRQAASDEGRLHEAARVKYSDFAAEWIDRYHGKPGKEFRESTRRDYRRDLKHSIEFFGDKRVGEISPHDIARFVAWLNDPTKQGREFAPSTLRNKVAPLAACLGTAFEERLIPVNPATRINYPGKSTGEVTLTPGDVDGETAGANKALSREQLDCFLRVVRPDYRLMFEFLAVTGLRVGEACALQWRHLDLNGATPEVRVRRQVYRGEVQTPKRNSRREVPLSLEMADALAALKSKRRTTEPTDLVFVNSRGGVIHQSNVTRDVLKPAAAEAGAEWAGFHTFRHTCASLLFDGGRNIVQISKWLGHHSPDFTLRTYVHLLNDDKGGPLLLGGGNTGGNVTGRNERESELAIAA